MSNLMIEHGGALGDCMWEVPALNVLQDHFDQIYQSGRERGEQALGATGLIDRFINKPPEFKSWDDAYKRQWLTYQTRGIEWDTFVNLHGVVPARLMHHEKSFCYNLPVECKRRANKGKNYFDEITLRFQEALGIDLSEAVGKRPITKHTEAEKALLRDFRSRYDIPASAFLLGYQFAGSSRIKWWPYFKEAIQENIMQRYPEVYLIGLGDLDGVLEWDYAYHHGRYVNLEKNVTFREAYVLTSIFDLLVSPETGVYNAAQAYDCLPKILLATHTDGTHITCGGESTILTPECDCAPCYDVVHTCKIDKAVNAPLCIASIKPEVVVNAIEEVIQRKQRMDMLRIQSGMLTLNRGLVGVGRV